MRRLVSIVGLGVVLLLCGSVLAADAGGSTLSRIVQNGEVRIGMSGNQPPFVMKDRKGQLIGFEVDLAETLADAMDVKLTIVQKPFAQLLPALEGGEVDLVMSGMTMTAERSLDFAFVGPYYVSGKSVLTEDRNLARIEKTTELNQPGLTLVALQGSTSEDYVKNDLPDTKLLTAPDYGAAVKMVLDGKAKAMVADLPACVVTMLRHPDAGLTTSSALLTLEPIGVAMPLDDPVLEKYVTNILEAVEATGQIEEMKKYWFEGARWLSMMPE
jgi:polar amino acid transport system substrate-binding protein